MKGIAIFFISPFLSLAGCAKGVLRLLRNGALWAFAVRQYRESYDVYGTAMSFEGKQLQDESHVIFDGGAIARRINVPETDRDTRF